MKMKIDSGGMGRGSKKKEEVRVAPAVGRSESK
jgi:hypothetical protein